MPIKKITVLGAGTMGAQISVQIAKHGYEVSLHARHPERFQETLRELQSYSKETGRIPEPVLEEWLKGAEKVRLCMDLEEALREADLVVEAVSENLELKRKIFAQMDSLAPRGPFYPRPARRSRSLKSRMRPKGGSDASISISTSYPCWSIW